MTKEVFLEFSFLVKRWIGIKNYIRGVAFICQDYEMERYEVRVKGWYLGNGIGFLLNPFGIKNVLFIYI